MSQQITAKARAAVTARAAGLCEMGCGARGEHAHHRTPRGAGGSREKSSSSPANLLWLCARCHGRTEHERTDGYADGRLVPRGTDPASVPVRLRHPIYGPAWWTLHDDGLMSWAGPYEQERP